jgi:hypothetical protein
MSREKERPSVIDPLIQQLEETIGKSENSFMDQPTIHYPVIALDPDVMRSAVGEGTEWSFGETSKGLGDRTISVTTTDTGDTLFPGSAIARMDYNYNPTPYEFREDRVKPPKRTLKSIDIHAANVSDDSNKVSREIHFTEGRYVADDKYIKDHVSTKYMHSEARYGHYDDMPYTERRMYFRTDHQGEEINLRLISTSRQYHDSLTTRTEIELCNRAMDVQANIAIRKTLGGPKDDSQTEITIKKQKKRLAAILGVPTSKLTEAESGLIEDKINALLDRYIGEVPDMDTMKQLQAMFHDPTNPLTTDN